MLGFSWQNGALAFLLAFVMFSLILLLVLLVAVRNALLGVLLVLLPIFTIMWPIPTLAPLARKGWLWFAELAFLPCVIVIPLELAVGCPSSTLLVGYLVAALGSPALLGVAGGSLTTAGIPSAGGALVGGVQRGLSSLSIGAGTFIRPIANVVAGSGSAGLLANRVGQALERPFPSSIAGTAGVFLGHGADHLFRHMAPRSKTLGEAEFPRFQPMRGA